LGSLGILTLISGISTIAITRVFGPSNYGQYASALATSVLLGALSDFGFSLLLSRDAGLAGPPDRSMLVPAYQVATAWCVVLAAAQVGLALQAGLATTRGAVLLILTPSMILNGLNPARVVFLLTYRTRRLLVIDAATAAVQLTAILILLALGGGPAAVAAVLSTQSVLNNVVVFWAAQRLMVSTTAATMPRRELLRRSLPLGLVSVMTRVFFTIDLVVLGYIVSGPGLGDYAAASKMLAILAGIAGVVMTGALPALSMHARSRTDIERLVARVWHLLIVVAVPAVVAVALLAPIVIRVTVGSRYDGAVSLLQILCLAGVVSVLNNLLGNLMIAFHKMRALFVQNLAAIILNVTGNLILVPRFGVAAAAWLTLATELLVCGLALIVLRGELSFRQTASVSVRPGAAIALSAGLGLVLARLVTSGTTLPALAFAISAVVFVLCMTVLRGWPQEFRKPSLRLRLRPVRN
jgi:O-antigen/teichoic acid export membrane protein